MKLTLEERIAHGGHKVLRWMMDNVYVRQDPAGNIKMDKEKSTEKIDAAVATVMALDRAIRNQGSEGVTFIIHTAFAVSPRFFNQVSSIGSSVD